MPMPAISVPSEEEEEILMEARNLARRLHRIKSKARNAQNAARLMTQVRAALSEERRVGTPEEEIEALWDEVDRLAKERTAEATDPGDAAVPETGEPEPVESEPEDSEPEDSESDDADTTAEPEDADSSGRFGNGLVPPAEAIETSSRRRLRGRDPPP